MKARCITSVLLLLVCVCILTIILVVPGIAGSVNFEKHWIAHASVYVVTADLNDPQVTIKIGLPAKGIPNSESFLSMVNRHTPVAAITGTYFDTRTLYPVGSIVIAGEMKYESAIGTVVCFTRENRVTCTAMAPGATQPAATGPYTVRIVPTSKGECFDWTGVDVGFRSGPRLLSKGYYVLNPRREGYRHPGLFGTRTRMAFGLTQYNKLLLVSVRTPVTFGKLAAIMKRLGSVEAVALDGGTSSAMYYRGKILRRPGRTLTNIIEVHVTQQAPQPVDQLALDVQKVWGIPADLIGPRENPDHGAYIERPTLGVGPTIDRSSFMPLFPFANLQRVSVLPMPSDLSFAKGRRTVFPIYGAQLSGLKSLNNSNHLIYVAPDVKVMHHFIA